jgi:hypothetical protein
MVDELASTTRVENLLAQHGASVEATLHEKHAHSTVREREFLQFHSIAYQPGFLLDNVANVSVLSRRESGVQCKPMLSACLKLTYIC